MGRGAGDGGSLSPPQTPGGTCALPWSPLPPPPRGQLDLLPAHVDALMADAEVARGWLTMSGPYTSSFFGPVVSLEPTS